MSTKAHARFSSVASSDTGAHLLRVAVVDDDESARLCYQDILRSSGNFSLAGSFSNATEALQIIPRLQPHLTLMDIRLPDLNGIECTKRLILAMPYLKIVMVTGTHEENLIEACLQAGAVAYLVKPFVEDQFLAIMKFASFEKKLNVKSTKDECYPTGCSRNNLPLTCREKEVLSNLAQGLLYKEISEKLGISYGAVHKYQHNIFKKLHVSNRSEAIRFWLDRHG
jgi:DNA-binding NarL/FixJ family response regulator